MAFITRDFIYAKNNSSLSLQGAAGFVGMHTCVELKAMGMNPVGYDNVNSYYSTELKEKRLKVLKEKDIPFVKGDVCDVNALKKTIQEHKITRVIHLAAQGKFLWRQNPKASSFESNGHTKPIHKIPSQLESDIALIILWSILATILIVQFTCLKHWSSWG